LARDLAKETLFGHVKGAYTQAHEDAPGWFETADGGTLFIDEIGELPLELRPRLLRALDRREVQRLGDRTCRRVDVRVGAATNRDLRQMVLGARWGLPAGSVLPTHRGERSLAAAARSEDIDYIADALLVRFSEERGIDFSLSDDSRDVLRRHGWPGNVRELYKALRRASRLSQSEVITAKDIRLVLGPGANGGVPSYRIVSPGRRFPRI
jgi:transcriptional regulator with GAF, ATPase, and Fis domain